MARWDNWASYESTDNGLSTLTVEPTVVGTSPYIDTDDESASYVGLAGVDFLNTPKNAVFPFPAGTNLRRLASRVSQSGYVYRLVASLRYVNWGTIGTDTNMLGFAYRSAGTWNGAPGLATFDAHDAAGGAWQVVTAEKVLPVASVTFYQDYADTGDFALTFSRGLNFAGPQVQLSYVALLPGIQDRLRQRQRDDLRARQRESQQLTPRGRSYW